MARLRDIRDLIAYEYGNNELTDDEFMLLYDINSSKNPDFPYWHYEKFDISLMDDEECWSEFRFHKLDIPGLKAALRIPDYISTYNRLRKWFYVFKKVQLPKSVFRYESLGLEDFLCT